MNEAFRQLQSKKPYRRSRRAEPGPVGGFNLCVHFLLNSSTIVAYSTL